MTTTFEPSFDLIQEDDCNTLLLYLPGFTKEQLKVQLTRSKELKISGTRVISENKLISFQKDFPIPENCDTSKISAKFEEGILYVRQPKLIVPAPIKSEDKITPPSPPPKQAEHPPAPTIDPHPNLEGPKPGPNNLDGPKPSPSNLGDSKQEGEVKDFQEKKKEEKQSNKDEKVTGRQKKDDRKVTAVKDFQEKKKEEKQSNKDEKVTGRKKKDDRKVTAVKSERVSPGVGGYSVVNAAGKLKMGREKMMKIVLFVFAFGLGVYVSNKLPNWFSRNV